MRNARKAKNAARNRPAVAPSPDAAFGSLADRLGARLQRAPDAAPAPAQPPAPAPAPPRAPDRVTAAELMRRAFEAAEAQSVFDAKYLGSGFRASDVELIDEHASPDLAPDLPVGDISPDDLLFAETMGGHVQPMNDRDRYADFRGHDWVGARWATEAELTSMSAEQLHQPDLTPQQRELLKRSRKGRDGLPTLNIRLERLGPALAEVEVFVRAQAQRGTRHVRIITGKGRNSAGDPVLKPGVIAWCEGEGSRWVRRWAPETDRSGNFGCVVLELDPHAMLRDPR